MNNTKRTGRAISATYARSFRIPFASSAILTLFASAVLAAPALAQNTAQPSSTITYRDALGIALQRNVAVRLAQNALATNDASVKQAKMQFFPDLRANTSTAQSYGRNFNSNDGTIVNSTTQSVNAGLSSSVTLFDGMRTLSSYRQAQFTSDASEQDLVRTQQTAIFTVASNYVALVTQQEQLLVQQQSLLAQEDQELLVQAYVDAGSRPISDLYTQQASVANARLSVVQARRGVELARIDIMQTLQLDPAGAYTFEAPLVSDSALAPGSIALDSLITRALARRVDLFAGESRVNAASADLRGATSTRWPTLSLSVGYNTSYSSASDFDFSDQLDQRRGGSIGLGLSFPVFDRASRSTATQRASIQYESAQIALQSQRQSVGLEVRRAWLDLESARAQRVAALAQVRAAELALTSSEERYRAGVSTLVELANARTVQVQAASALVSARYNLVLQQTVLSYFVGDISAERSTLE